MVFTSLDPVILIPWLPRRRAPHEGPLRPRRAPTPRPRFRPVLVESTAMDPEQTACIFGCATRADRHGAGPESELSSVQDSAGGVSRDGNVRHERSEPRAGE